MSTVIDRLVKLLELSRQGVGGEKDNAKRAFDRMLQKHGLRPEDLEMSVPQMQWFRCPRGQWGQKLLGQIFGSVGLGSSYYTRLDKPGFRGVNVTAAQRIEIEIKLSAYEPALKQALDLTYRAFVHSNQIFPNEERPEDFLAPETDPAELRKLALAMMAIPRVPIHKALENSQEAAA
jgi:hypothetical protein